MKFSYILFCLLTGLAEAEEIEEELSDQELVTACEEGATPGQPNQYCIQYVFGLVQTIEILQAAGPEEAIFYIGPEVTRNIIDWLQDRSERLHKDAYLPVTQALYELYPCTESEHLTKAYIGWKQG